MVSPGYELLQIIFGSVYVSWCLDEMLKNIFSGVLDIAFTYNLIQITDYYLWLFKTIIVGYHQLFD